MSKRYSLLRYFFTITIVIVFILSSIIPNISGDIVNTTDNYYSYKIKEKNSKDEHSLDIKFIYNLTENLSNIIFDVYDEEHGEIAKGRAFGTKGEHKAADILYENMSNIGLYTIKEKIKNTEKYPNLTHELEVVDYFIKINNRTIDSYIAPVWSKTSENGFNLNYTYNYKNLKVITPPPIPSVYMIRKYLNGDLEPFLIIMKDEAFYPYNPLEKIPIIDNFYVTYYIIRQLQGGIPAVYSWLWDKYMDYCKGIILYDFNEETHDMNLLKNVNHLPFLYINGTDGNNILDNINDLGVDFKLTQRLNTSIISYNVIGQINGTDKNQTVIVDSLYDSWWCQGAADSAIGMSIVVAIAKYFRNNNITPYYTIKFIGFGGEEHGFCAGSKYYESSHPNENITYIVDLNQLGFNQEEPKLTLNVIANKLGFLFNISKIIKKTDYKNLVNSSKGIDFILMKNGGPSNTCAFAPVRDDLKTVVFLKDGGWKLHHRDGLNHTEGDVLKYFDLEDVVITSGIILDVILTLTLK